MDSRSDPLYLEILHKIRAAQGEFIRQPDNVLVIDMAHTLYSSWRDEAFDRKVCVIELGILPAPLIEFLQFFQLHNPEGSTDIGHAVIVPETGMEVFLALTMVDDQAQPFVVRFVARGDHATLTGNHILRCIEGEAPEIPEPADFLSFVERAMSLRRILYEFQTMGLAAGLDCQYIEGLAEQVDADNGLRLRGNPFLDLRGEDIECLFINISKDRFCTAHRNSSRSGNERKGRDDNLVSLPDIRSKQCRVQRGGAVIDRNRVGSPAEISKLLLEFRDTVSGSQHTGLED
jgi:hypothetical protein